MRCNLRRYIPLCRRQPLLCNTAPEAISGLYLTLRGVHEGATYCYAGVRLATPCCTSAEASSGLYLVLRSMGGGATCVVSTVPILRSTQTISGLYLVLRGVYEDDTYCYVGIRLAPEAIWFVSHTTRCGWRRYILLCSQAIHLGCVMQQPKPSLVCILYCVVYLEAA